MKWADYAIVAVKFKKEKRHIEQVKIKKDEGEKLVAEQIVSRQEIVSALEKGISFVTAFLKESSWMKGDQVKITIINNTKFIKTDGNNKEEDNLGQLPEF